MEEKGLPKGESDPWTVLEFYSGIGGMRYSLREAGIPATIVEAFDINDTANDVYEFNFGHRPHQMLGCYLLHVSPIHGLQKHSEDARALSFIKIFELIPHMVHPPLFLFVENVVGFETSDTHQQLTEILVRTGFVTQEYILSPLQFGIPYSRPRYFCLAKRKPSSFQNPCYNYKLLCTPTPFLSCEKSLEAAEANHNNEKLEELKPSCLPIKHFLETQTFSGPLLNEELD